MNSYEKYHIADLIHEASTGNGHYGLYLREPLTSLKGRFDLKYWPQISAVVDEIANDACSSEIYATDSVSQANISSARNSLTDYFKAFFQAVKEEKRHNSLISFWKF